MLFRPTIGFVSILLIPFFSLRIMPPTQDPEPCAGCAPTVLPKIGAVGEVSLDLLGDYLDPLPIPKPIKILVDLIESIEFIETATILSWVVETTAGDCKPVFEAEPGEPYLCSGGGCLLSLSTEIRANDYVRFPFTDAYEEIKLLDGTTKKLWRGDFFNSPDSLVFELEGETFCGLGSVAFVALEFENGTLVQPWVCAKCIQTL